MNKNNLKLLEALTIEIVQNSLNSRFDICTCSKCRNDITNHVLAKISASSTLLLSDNPEENRSFFQKEISRTMIPAIDYVSKHPSHADCEDHEKIFKGLLHKISHERGLDLRNYHSELLKRRIALRLQHNNIASYSKYIVFLSQNPDEYDKLFETLCINISEFFRDSPVWVTIQSLFENLIQFKIKKCQGSIRVWSAGCANGEEPYSLAINLKEALRGITPSPNIEVLATDVDKTCLNFAEKAVYNKDSVKNVSPKLLARYFEFSGGKFHVRDEIKKMVSWSYLDLTSQEYPENIDVLCCRNVFIYFNRQLQKQILDKFCSSLTPEGYLIMGRSETLGSEYEHYFETIDSNARIFRKSLKTCP